MSFFLMFSFFGRNKNHQKANLMAHAIKNIKNKCPFFKLGRIKKYMNSLILILKIYIL